MLPFRFLFARPALLLLLMLALLPFLGLVFFAQPGIDDFDNTETVARLGRLGAQWHWYNNWSGRFISIGFSTAFNPLSYAPRAAAGPTGLVALRGILLLLALGLLVALQQFFRALLLVLSPPADADHEVAQPALGLAWPLALAVLTFGLNALPEPFTLLYWYSGAANYALPLVLTLGFAACALRSLRLLPGAVGRRGWALGAAVYLLGAVGGSEMALLASLLVLAGLGIWTWTTRLDNRRLWLGWAVVGVVTAGLMLGAPGNWRRAALTDPGPRAQRWLMLAPRTALAAARLAARPPVLGSVLVLAGAVLLTSSGRAPRPSRRVLTQVLGGFALLNIIGVAFMKSVWVDALPSRVTNTLVLQLLISSAALALWARPWLPLAGPVWLRGRWASPALVGLTLVLLLTGQARRAWQELLFVAPAYSSQMQTRYAALEAAHQRGAAEAVLEPLLLPYSTGLLVPIPSSSQRVEVNLELNPDSTHKSNRHLARYYGLHSVRLSGPAPARP